MLTRRSLLRFAKSASAGFLTFSFDLALLFLLIDVFHLFYVVAAGVAFIAATSLNYLISRRFVFTGSARSVHAGYAFFLLIAAAGLLFITTLMYVFVDILDLHDLLSRVLIACVVGWWNYLMNLYVNFRVAGK